MMKLINNAKNEKELLEINLKIEANKNYNNSLAIRFWRPHRGPGRCAHRDRGQRRAAPRRHRDPRTAHGIPGGGRPGQGTGPGAHQPRGQRL